MPVPSALIAKYFQFLANRQFTEAKHEMDIIKFYVYSFLPEREFESLRQLLAKEQFNEARHELDRLRQLLADKHSAIVAHEFERFKRNFGSKQPLEIQQKLEIIRQLLVKCQFTEAAQETGKLEQLLIARKTTEALHELKRFKWILTNRRFADITEDLDSLRQLLESRHFTEIERELGKLKHEKKRTDWDKGYYRALYGMMLARKSNNNDSYIFFSKLEVNDKAALNAYKREFLEHVNDKLHGDFDRGFFSAWADCMRVLSKIDVSNIPKVNVSNANNVAATESEPKLEHLEDDENQATMESFLEGEGD